MTRSQPHRLLPFALLLACAIPGAAQGPSPAGVVPPKPVVPAPPARGLRPADAQRTRNELTFLMQRFPPNLREVLSIDPSLLSNQTFLTPYPDLSNFLEDHPEVVRDPSFYFPPPNNRGRNGDSDAAEIWRAAMDPVAPVLGIAIVFIVAAWVLRAVLDHRRWTRLNQIQTDAHSRILDRLSNNEELLAYIQSPAGSKFLESAPIQLNAAPLTPSSPMTRIIWTIQGGIVLAAGGGGLLFISSNPADEVTRPLHGLGILAIAVGAGFVISAIISFVISQRFGLVETPPRAQE